MRLQAHVCTCTHFRCRLIDAGRAAHTHRVNLRSVERFAASSSCSFFLTVPHLSSSHSSVRARPLARLASFARYRPSPSCFSRWTIRFLCRLTLLIALDRDIECRYVAERSTTITLPGERGRNGAHAVGAPGKTRIREKRTRVKGGARDTVLCNRRRFFFHLRRYREISGGLIVNLSIS